MMKRLLCLTLLTLASAAHAANTFLALDESGALIGPTANEVRLSLSLVPGTHVQAWDTDLDTWATVTSSANGRSLVSAANYAAMRGLLDLEAGTDFYSITAADVAFQAKDTDLNSWAAITRASGFDTFVATPSSANWRLTLTDENGTGEALFNSASAVKFTGNTTLDYATLTTGSFSAGSGGAHIGADASGRFTLSTAGSTDTMTIIPGTGQHLITGPSADGTLATLAGTETLTNKSIAASQLTGPIGNGTQAFNGTTGAFSDLFTQTRSGLGATPPAYGATTAVSALLNNSTAATVGTTVQIAPALRWHGSAWKSSATAAAQDQEWQAFVLPATGSAATTSTWRLQNSNNGAAFSDQITVSSAGVVTATTRFVNGGAAWRDGGGPQFDVIDSAAASFIRVRCGNLITVDTTDTTSGTSGAINTPGGIGVAKAAYIGTTLTVVGSSTLGTGGTAMSLVKHGSDTLSGGTTGAVSATWITTATRFIAIGRGTTNAGILSVTKVNATSYQIDSSNASDARTIDWIAIQ